MAQGIERNKNEVLDVLEPYLKTGCSVKKACEYAGIPQSTVQTWIENDDDLRVKITAWQNVVNASARMNVASSIQKGNITDSWTWLSKKEKDEFSGRQEITGPEGEPLGGLSEADRLALNKLHDILDQPAA